ncbi:MAG: imidazolonepropionase [Chloroflexi bacterium]|nr:imidazolonepropionase [Chloroflexota bacterium]
MLIHSASQILTLSGGPQRGRQLGELGIIEDGALVILQGIIQDVGATSELVKKYSGMEQIDASGKVLMPGFVDAHTHVVWAGDRATEFELRLQGKTYLEILEAGGGILATVTATREASLEELIAQTRPRLQTMFLHGSTTIEAKTGYGLELESELRQLEALLRLDKEGPWELAITILAAHAVPAEFKGKANDYVGEICERMLPRMHEWWLEYAGERPLPFVDVFCETGAFDMGQSRQILETAINLGFPVKIHADEFDNLGGAALAIELGAVSADHLVSTSNKEIAAFGENETVAVALPATPFGLAERDYTPARKIIEAGGLLAVASDLNPGTAWGESLQFALALACRYLKLTPAEAIAASTINAAAAISRQNQIGSLEVGKQADMLLLSVDDYRHVGYRFGTNLVHTVIKKGQLYSAREIMHAMD